MNVTQSNPSEIWNDSQLSTDPPPEVFAEAVQIDLLRSTIAICDYFARSLKAPTPMHKQMFDRTVLTCELAVLALTDASYVLQEHTRARAYHPDSLQPCDSPIRRHRQQQSNKQLEFPKVVPPEAVTSTGEHAQAPT